MNVFRALIRRELFMFFQGPTGFIIISAVLFLIGLGFLVVLYGLNGEATPMPVTQIFLLVDFTTYCPCYYDEKFCYGTSKRHIRKFNDFSSWRLASGTFKIHRCINFLYDSLDPSFIMQHSSPILCR